MSLSPILHSISQGQGRPVLLIHGMAASCHDWDRLLPALAEAGFHAIAPDLLGHGESEKPPERDAYTAANLYAAFEAWIKSLHLDVLPIFIGHSLGGYLSLEYARRHPGSLAGMVLIDPLFSPRQISPMVRRLLKRGLWGAAALHHTPAWLISGALRLDPVTSTSPLVRHQTVLDYKRASPQIMHIPASIKDLSGMVTTLKVPSLVMWGELDLTLQPSSFPRLVSLLPQASGHAFARTGHQPHRQRPLEVQRLVLEFIHACELTEKSRSNPEPVTLTLREETFQVKPGSNLRAALRKIGVQSETVLAIRSGEMITDDEILLSGDQINLVHVISGG